jgi:ceramide glucosyltransferase
MHITRDVLMLLTIAGALQAVAGLLAVRVFAARPPRAPAPQPPVTILKPVCGDEPLLEEAIASFCTQDYPAFQLVIGAQDPDDPALAVARRLQARFSDHDITVVADSTWHGANRKIANVMNMLPYAKHDVLVLADSDLHVLPDYLAQVVAALQLPGTGLVTTLCGGEPAAPGIAARLGATHISHSFLPGALLSVALGRQDCLGGTMALRRDTLARVGGLGALVDHLADDNVLGTLVHRLGLTVRLADTLPVVTVQERALHPLWLHELRWARTIGALAPLVFAASTLQFPLLWGALAVLLSGGALSALLAFAAAFAIRGAVVWGIDQTLRPVRARPAQPTPWWLLPLRDALSVAEIMVSYWNDVVVWRGHTLHADRGPVGPALPDVADVIVEDETLPA